jgi:AraC-like DNA-binding protein
VSIVVDTTQLPAEERFDAWARASLAVFEPIAVTNRSTAAPFHGRLVRHEIGPLQVLRLSADASAARRTARLVAASDPETVQLMLQLQGVCAIRQDERAAVVPAGGLSGWHSSSPYEVASDRAFQILIVTCPTALLGRDADRVRRGTARHVDGSAGTGYVAREYVRSVAQVLDAGACSERARDHLAEGLFDLIRALHADDGVRPAARPADRLRTRVDRYIDANLEDRGLTRAAIAREHFISLRQLDRLYADGPGGAAAAIRAKRLDRVRRDLADPSLADRSVYEIAVRWGFGSPSHFSRAFRAAYGQSPTAFRESARRR